MYFILVCDTNSFIPEVSFFLRTSITLFLKEKKATPIINCATSKIIKTINPLTNVCEKE